MPQSSRPLFRIAAFGAIAATLTLGACGRKGPLDLPPANSMQSAPAEGQPDAGAAPAQPPVQGSAFGSDGRPIAPRGQKRKVPGDWLID